MSRFTIVAKKSGYRKSKIKRSAKVTSTMTYFVAVLVAQLLSLSLGPSSSLVRAFAPTRVPSAGARIDDRTALRVVTSREYQRQYCAGDTSSALQRDQLVRVSERFVATPRGRLTAEQLSESHVLMEAWAKRGEARTVERLLKRVVDEKSAGNPAAVLSTHTYNLCLEGWARDGSSGAPLRAEEILRRMHDDARRRRETRDHAPADDCAPNTLSFNLVLDAWARDARLRAEAPARVEAIVEWMERGRGDAPPPDADSYNAWIRARAASRDRSRGRATDAARRAREARAVLDRAERRYRDGDASTRARPNRTSYSLVLSAYARAGLAAEATELHADMERLWREERRRDLRPNTVTYTVVLDAHARSADASPTAAEDVLSEMIRLYESGENPDVKPNTVTLNTVLNAWGLSGAPDADRRADRILSRMEDRYYCDRLTDDDVRPDTFSYTTVIRCLCAHGRVDRASDVLDRMIDLFAAGDAHVRPHVRSFMPVLDAHAKAGRPDEVDALFDRMGRLRNGRATTRRRDDDHDDEPLLRHNALTYNTRIDALARSDVPDKAVRARNVLREMEDLHAATGDPNLRPNDYVYTTVINACAFTDHPDHRADARRVMEDTWARLNDDDDGDDRRRSSRRDASSSSSAPLGPSCVSYGVLVKACANLLPPDELVDALRAHFRECRRRGLFCNLMLKNLRESLSPRDFADVMEEAVAEDESSETTKPVERWNHVSDAPASWSRNALRVGHQNRNNLHNRDHRSRTRTTMRRSHNHHHHHHYGSRRRRSRTSTSRDNDGGSASFSSSWSLTVPTTTTTTTTSRSLSSNDNGTEQQHQR